MDIILMLIPAVIWGFAGYYKGKRKGIEECLPTILFLKAEIDIERKNRNLTLSSEEKEFWFSKN